MYLQVMATAGGLSAGQVLGAIGGALPVVGGIVSSLINNADTTANNQANEQFQLQQQQAQDTYNTQMWNNQNAYNAPDAQMSRLEDAGLNPNLVYGSGNVTGNVAEAAPSMAKVEYVSAPQRAPDLASDLTSGLAAYNNLQLGSAQSDNLAAQTHLANSTSQLQSTEAALNAASTDKTVAETSTIPAITAATVANMQSQTFKNDVDSFVSSTLLPLQEGQLSADATASLAAARANLTNAQQNVIKTAVDVKTGIAQIAALAIQNAKSQTEIANIKAQTALVLGNKDLQKMDITMRQQGEMPNNSAAGNVIGAFATWLTGHNQAGGYNSNVTPNAIKLSDGTQINPDGTTTKQP